jgi:hypothetical protein
MSGAPNLGLPTDQLHQGDCLEGLARVRSGSIDLAFADPPFNIGYEYDVYDDRREAEAYLDWSKRWMGEISRVLKPDGTFWLAIGDEFAAELKVIAHRELGFTPRSWVVWYYTFGVHCKKKFARSHAHLFHFVKDPKNYTLRPPRPAPRRRRRAPRRRQGAGDEAQEGVRRSDRPLAFLAVDFKWITAFPARKRDVDRREFWTDPSGSHATERLSLLVLCQAPRVRRRGVAMAPGLES